MSAPTPITAPFSHLLVCRRALRVSPGSPADVRLLPRTVAGGLRCAWLCTFYVRTRRLVPSRPCPWRRPMKTVSERPPPCTKPQMSRPSTRATGSRATLTARAWARRVGFLGHRRNRRCPLNTLTPKTICEGLCGPVHVNALFGHVNALFGGCRVPVEFPLSCQVVEASWPGLNVWFIFCSRLVFSPDAGERDLRRSAVERASDVRPRPREPYSPREP